jgi:hypothetical protein
MISQSVKMPVRSTSGGIYVYYSACHMFRLIIMIILRDIVDTKETSDAKTCLRH